MLGVSVVIPCYNAAKYIREAIDSVLAQQYGGSLEILVSDDGSDDGSYEMAKSYGPPVRVVEKPPEVKRGASFSLNRGIRNATQPLLAILAADDVFLPGHLNAVATVLTHRRDLGLVYDNGYLASPDLKVFQPILPEPHRPCRTADDLLPAQTFGACSVIVRREIFDEIGVFDETLRHAEDYDMWLRILEKHPAEYVPIFGFKYRQHSSQKSLKPTLWEDAELVFQNACRRYPYSPSSIRKRKAVLSYRFSQIAFQENRFVRGVCLLLKAASLDPQRAIREAGSRLHRRLLQGT